MSTYICSVCGYIYDETAGIQDDGIANGIKWGDIHKDWVCPLCGAAKNEFEEQNIGDKPKQSQVNVPVNEAVRQLSYGEMSALCSNLSKGCEKQYLPKEAECFNQLAGYFNRASNPEKGNQFADIYDLIQQNISTDFAQANVIAAENSDRGALRALVWGEKVTRMLSSILSRYEKKKDALLKDTNVYVCEICGFIYLGNKLPKICPVCKVPNMKMRQIRREAI